MSKNKKICDIYRKNNRLAIELNLKLMHNTNIETQKRGETAMQIKITVDIENTDILKFFELFKKDLATVAKNTTVETVEDKNESADLNKEQPQKKAQKKQSKNDCADFSGVQEQEEPQTEEKSDNTADNSLEHEFNFNAAPINAKVEIVKNILVSMAKNGRKTEAKDILNKNKVPALSKLCGAEEKILVKIYNEVKNANAQ